MEQKRIEKWMDVCHPHIPLNSRCEKGCVPFLQPATDVGGALPTPTFPTAPQLNLYHSETYRNGFCTCLLLIKCFFVTHWGSYSVPRGASVSKKQTTYLDIGIFPPDLMLLLMSFSFIKSFLLLLILFIAEPLVIWKLLLYSWEMKDFTAVKYKWIIWVNNTHTQWGTICVRNALCCSLCSRAGEVLQKSAFYPKYVVWQRENMLICSPLLRLHIAVISK